MQVGYPSNTNTNPTKGNVQAKKNFTRIFLVWKDPSVNYPSTKKWPCVCSTFSLIWANVLSHIFDSIQSSIIFMSSALEV